MIGFSRAQPQAIRCSAFFLRQNSNPNLDKRDSFTYVETGKRASLGAYHGLELKFLSREFPHDWEHSADDLKLAEAVRTYWTQFAKTGEPDTSGVPRWPVYGSVEDACMDLGRTISLSNDLHEARLQELEHIMQLIFANYRNIPPPGESE